MARTQVGTFTSSHQDPEPAHPVPPSNHATVTRALCWAPKSWDSWRPAACCLTSWRQEKSYGGQWNQWAAALSTVSENNSITAIRKVWFLMACQKGVPAEACLVLTGRTQHPQQRGQGRWASRTLFLRDHTGNERGGSLCTAMATSSVEGSSLSPLSRCTQIQLFPSLFGWQRVEWLLSVRSSLYHIFR